MNILVTGMSGVGKSTLCQLLVERGFVAYDLDEIEGLCHLYHPDGSIVADYENRRDLNMLETEYLCDIEKLRAHISRQSGVVFYCGFVDNFKDVAVCFEKIVLLTIPAEENKRRMSIRTTTEFAKDEKTQDELMAYKNEWEAMVAEHDPLVVDASAESEEVGVRVLQGLGM